MAWSTTGVKNKNGGTSNALTIGLTGTPAGAHIFVGVSFWISGGPPASPNTHVSDDVNGAYTEAFYAVINDQGGGLWYFENGAGGNLTITITTDSGTPDLSAYAECFSGGLSSSSGSGTPATSTGNGATYTTGSMTPSHNDVLLIGVIGLDAVGRTITENAASTNPSTWSLSDEEEGASTQNGAMVYKIVSGSAGTAVHNWTVSGAACDRAGGIAAFQAASVAGRYTHNTRNSELGVQIGMGIRMPL